MQDQEGDCNNFYYDAHAQLTSARLNHYLLQLAVKLNHLHLVFIHFILDVFNDRRLYLKFFVNVLTLILDCLSDAKNFVECLILIFKHSFLLLLQCHCRHCWLPMLLSDQWLFFKVDSRLGLNRHIVRCNCDTEIIFKFLHHFYTSSPFFATKPLCRSYPDRVLVHVRHPVKIHDLLLKRIQPTFQQVIELKNSEARKEYFQNGLTYPGR